MTPGDLVWYRQIHPGGYGFANRVPAVYRRTTARRIVIEVMLRHGGFRVIAVMPHNVSPRQPDEGIVWTR